MEITEAEAEAAKRRERIEEVREANQQRRAERTEEAAPPNRADQVHLSQRASILSELSHVIKDLAAEPDEDEPLASTDRVAALKRSADRGELSTDARRTAQAMMDNHARAGRLYEDL